MGGILRGRRARSSENTVVETGFSLLVRTCAICLIIESLIMMAEGEKLKAELEEVGAGSVQLSAQQTLAISVTGASKRPFALSQQSISPFIFSVCSGIPDTMLPHNARNRKIDVSRLNTSLKYFLFFSTVN